MYATLEVNLRMKISDFVLKNLTASLFCLWNSRQGCLTMGNSQVDTENNTFFVTSKVFFLNSTLYKSFCTVQGNTCSTMSGNNKPSIVSLEVIIQIFILRE